MRDGVKVQGVGKGWVARRDSIEVWSRWAGRSSGRKERLACRRASRGGVRLECMVLSGVRVSLELIRSNSLVIAKKAVV